MQGIAYKKWQISCMYTEQQYTVSTSEESICTGIRNILKKNGIVVIWDKKRMTGM